MHFIGPFSRFLTRRSAGVFILFGALSAQPAIAQTSIVANAQGDIVLPTATAPRAGKWAVASDATAAAGKMIRHPDEGVAKGTTAAASPANYFDMLFEAEAGKAYRLWVHGRADANYWGNDSVFVQFSRTVDGSGAAVYRIGSTSATQVNIEDCSGCGLAGWGWNDQMYGGLAPNIVFDRSGAHTIRIQPREDGLTIDQVSVVRIGDRAVVVPVPLDVAEQSGFETIATSDESLFALGVRPTPRSSGAPAAPSDAVRDVLPGDAAALPAGREPEVAVARLDAADVSDMAAGVGDVLAFSDDLDGFMADAPNVGAGRNAGPLQSEADVSLADTAVIPRGDDTDSSAVESSPAPTLEWPAVERRVTDRRSGVGDGARPVRSDLIRLETTPLVQSPATEVAATVDAALPGSPQHRFRFSVHPGEVVIVTGEGGSGKTSLLRVLGGLDGPSAGHVTVGGVALEALSDEERLVREAVSPGFFGSSGYLVADLTVIENVELPLLVGGATAADAR